MAIETVDQRPEEVRTLHPKHPGRGCSTSLMAAEGDKPEQGGFFVFLPSGATKVVRWSTDQPINPTRKAARSYTAQLIEQLHADDQRADIDTTNWSGVINAVQRIVVEWNARRSTVCNFGSAA